MRRKYSPSAVWPCGTAWARLHACPTLMLTSWGGTPARRTRHETTQPVPGCLVEAEMKTAAHSQGAHRRRGCQACKAAAAQQVVQAPPAGVRQAPRAGRQRRRLGGRRGPRSRRGGRRSVNAEQGRTRPSGCACAGALHLWPRCRLGPCLAARGARAAGRRAVCGWRAGIPAFLAAGQRRAAGRLRSAWVGAASLSSRRAGAARSVALGVRCGAWVSCGRAGERGGAGLAASRAARQGSLRGSPQPRACPPARLRLCWRGRTWRACLHRSVPSHGISPNTLGQAYLQARPNKRCGQARVHGSFGGVASLQHARGRDGGRCIPRLDAGKRPGTALPASGRARSPDRNAARPLPSVEAAAPSHGTCPPRARSGGGPAAAPAPGGAARSASRSPRAVAASGAAPRSRASSAGCAWPGARAPMPPSRSGGQAAAGAQGAGPWAACQVRAPRSPAMAASAACCTWAASPGAPARAAVHVHVPAMRREASMSGRRSCGASLHIGASEGGTRHTRRHVW